MINLAFTGINKQPLCTFYTGTEELGCNDESCNSGFWETANLPLPYANINT